MVTTGLDTRPFCRVAGGVLDGSVGTGTRRPVIPGLPRACPGILLGFGRLAYEIPAFVGVTGWWDGHKAPLVIPGLPRDLLQPRQLAYGIPAFAGMTGVVRGRKAGLCHPGLAPGSCTARSVGYEIPAFTGMTEGAGMTEGTGRRGWRDGEPRIVRAAQVVSSTSTPAARRSATTAGTLLGATAAVRSSRTRVGKPARAESRAVAFTQ